MGAVQFCMVVSWHVYTAGQIPLKHIFSGGSEVLWNEHGPSSQELPRCHFGSSVVWFGLVWCTESLNPHVCQCPKKTTHHSVILEIHVLVLGWERIRALMWHPGSQTQIKTVEGWTGDASPSSPLVGLAWAVPGSEMMHLTWSCAGHPDPSWDHPWALCYSLSLVPAMSKPSWRDPQSFVDP